MVQTLINLRDDLYKKLVELSIEKYGHARAISKVLNELLEEIFQKKRWKSNTTIKLEKEIDWSSEHIKELARESWIK